MTMTTLLAPNIILKILSDTIYFLQCNIIQDCEMALTGQTMSSDLTAAGDV